MKNVKETTEYNSMLSRKSGAFVDRSKYNRKRQMPVKIEYFDDFGPDEELEYPETIRDPFERYGDGD